MKTTHIRKLVAHSNKKKEIAHILIPSREWSHSGISQVIDGIMCYECKFMWFKKIVYKKEKAVYKGIDQAESKSPMNKSGGITTDSYQSLKPSGKGTSTINTADKAIAGGMTTAGGVTTDAMKSVKSAAKGSFSKPCKPGTDASE